MRRVFESAPIAIEELRVYPDSAGDEWLEFDSMINLRPSFGNRTRGIDDPDTRSAVVALIARLVRR